MSHFCEKARWALDHTSLPYREEPHLPVFQIMAAKRAGGGRTVPVLIHEGRVLDDSTAILKHADAWARDHGGKRLYPDDPETRREVEATEELCDEVLGPHVRRVVYFYLLGNKPLLLELVGDAGPRTESLCFRGLFPLFRLLMKKALRIDRRGYERSLLKLREVFDAIDKALADGRRYLGGEELGAADITFAALAAPILLPPEYFVPLPELTAVPDEFAALIRELQARPAGAFGLRVYRDERRLAGEAVG